MPNTTVSLFAFVLLAALPACDPNQHMVVYPFTDAPGSDTPGIDAGVPSEDAPEPRPDTPTADAPIEPPSDTPPPSTHGELSATLAEMLCASWARCDGCTPPTPTCVEQMTTIIDDMHRPEHFRAEDVDLYLRVLSVAYEDCDDLSPYEVDRLTPWRGPLEEGDLCSHFEDCETLRCDNMGAEQRCSPARSDDTRVPLCR